jgi:hypothetical protein
MLDNRHFVMRGDQQVRDYYQPIFVLDHDRVKRYSDTPSTSARPHESERTVGQIFH